MMTRHSDVAAYALGVLDEGAHDLFERHLTRCARCRRELVEFDVIPRVLQRGAQLGLFAQVAPASPDSDERGPKGRCTAVRSLLLIAGSLFVMAAAAVLAIADSSPADNHLSWCGSPLTHCGASSPRVSV
jgi:anti-sigma factor RsiW